MPIQIVPQPVVTPGAGDVTGGTNLTTANRVMIVAGSSEAGQSDVSLASGVFSRAGTLGLSATGANVIPFSTNGTERGRWSSGGNLLVGTTTDDGSSKLQIGGANYPQLAFISSAAGTVQSFHSTFSDGITNRAFWDINRNIVTGTFTNTGMAYAGIALDIGNGASRIFFRATNANNTFGDIQANMFGTGNWLLGDGGDPGYRLDIPKSGSTGTLRIYDQTATTGVTQVVVRAGAGQSTTALQTWQNNVAGTLAFLGSDGSLQLADSAFFGFGSISASNYAVFGSVGATPLTAINVKTAGTIQFRVNNTTYELLNTVGHYLASARVVGWSSTSDPAGTVDLGLARNAAGVLEVNNGTPGTYRDIIARSYVGTAVAAATLANSQFTFHLASNTEFVITAKGDDGTTRTATVTLT